MVDIAQLVSASDCGSEGRGFESHYPPHANPPLCGGVFFMGIVDNGIRKGGPSEGWVKIESERAIFSPWENPLDFGRIP